MIKSDFALLRPETGKKVFKVKGQELEVQFEELGQFEIEEARDIWLEVGEEPKEKSGKKRDAYNLQRAEVGKKFVLHMLNRHTNIPESSIPYLFKYVDGIELVKFAYEIPGFGGLTEPEKER